MDFTDLLAVIDARARELGVSERQVCRNAGLKAHAIRTIRRGHPPTLGRLRALAAALGLPQSRLVEAAADLRLDDAGALVAPLGETPSLLDGTGALPSRDRSESAGAPPGYVSVARLAGSVGVETTSAVLFPTSLIEAEFHGDARDFVIMEVEGPAMEPVLRARDQILIDSRRRVPVQPGLFALDQGLGPVVRWLEFVPGSEPPRYRVRAETPLSEPYEVEASTARLIGRVVWFARRI